MAHRFKNAHDVQVFALIAARQNGAAIDINGRYVGAQDAHHATGHVFVAAAHHQDTVHPLTLYAGFDAVRNDFATDQGVLHAFGAHGHAIGNGGCAKNLSVAAGCFNARHCGVGQFLQTTVARGDGAVTVGHAHHGFDKITLFVTHGVVHRAIGRP